MISNNHEILSIKEIYAVEQAAMDNNIPGLQLMENAGNAVARETADIVDGRKVVVLCGPGNNGGDGFVAARILKKNGIHVQVATLDNPKKLTGDAEKNFKRWDASVEYTRNIRIEEHRPLIVDALFGSGLNRPLKDETLKIVNKITSCNLDSIAIDIPSGINGDNGCILGGAIPAIKTVAFLRPKPGHFLYPGKEFCGELTIKDIGIPDSIVEKINPHIFINQPKLWSATNNFLSRHWSDNKYSRGHSIIFGGATMPGAAKLAAKAARRVGSGLATISCSGESFDRYCGDALGTIIESHASTKDFLRGLADKRKNAILIGPGAGLNKKIHEIVLQTLAIPEKSVVLDADALTIFDRDPKVLFDAIRKPCILTPHKGEFERLFELKGDRLSSACNAAIQSNAVIIFKGADTIIASPCGRSAINCNAPPQLATAGTGDVLAGLAVGILAQGISPFKAACAAVWLHSESARRFGDGLIAEDLIETLPSVLNSISRENKIEMQRTK